MPWHEQVSPKGYRRKRLGGLVDFMAKSSQRWSGQLALMSGWSRLAAIARMLTINVRLDVRSYFSVIVGGRDLPPLHVHKASMDLSRAGEQITEQKGTGALNVDQDGPCAHVERKGEYLRRQRRVVAPHAAEQS